MKHLTWWFAPLVVALVLGMVTADAVQAAKAGGGKAKEGAREKGDKGGGGSVRGEYAIMAKECGLTSEQRQQVQAMIEANKQAMAEWQKQHGEKAAQMQKAMKAAKEAGNKDEMKRLGQEYKTLATERNQLRSKTMTDVMTALTAEQKAKWNGFRLYRQMMMRYKKAGLTDEQTAMIREMADKVGPTLGDAADEKAARKIATDLSDQIKQGVLTEDQRSGLGKKTGKDRPEKGNREKKPKRNDAGAAG